MTSPLSILYVVNDMGFFLSHRLLLARAAHAAGYKVHVATPPSPLAHRIQSEGFEFHPIKLSRRGMWLWQELFSIFSLYSLYRTLQPDLVHHVTIKPVLYGGVAARLARVPAVVQAITGLGHIFVGRKWSTRLVRVLVTRLYSISLGHRNHRVVFQNPDDRDLFLRAGLVAEKNAVLIRGSGVDINEFVPVSEAPGYPLVVFAARMLWDKGVGEFVAAARELKSAGIVARFALVGDEDQGNPTSVSRQQLQEWAKEGVVEWWGRREDMPNVLALSHVVCLPTLYGEGVPKILIEAAAAGRPIVATDAPGCREIVQNGGNGLLVPPRDQKALAAAINKLITDPSLRKQMGKRGRELVRHEYSVSMVIENTLFVYQQLLRNVI